MKEIPGIPDEVRVVSLLPLGYPADVLRPKSRKSLDELVNQEKSLSFLLSMPYSQLAEHIFN
ncbi:MAG: hypothetical protein SCH70_11175 [Candidatus Methanoperedens sp.]|nr:hypothetical protein [Candidatus Methanoperedens sp.]